MSDMKCPFCQQELDYLAEDIYGNMYCPNCRDKNGFTYKASESIWQELIRIHKALDVAIDEIKKIKVAAESVGIGFFMTAAIFALEKIKTALEQKDVK